MSSSSVVATTSRAQLVQPAQGIAPQGLSSEEARIRLQKDGPNAMPDTSAHPLRDVLGKFWAPVPWLLEAAILLEIVLHKFYEAAVLQLCSFSTPHSLIFRRVMLRRLLPL